MASAYSSSTLVNVAEDAEVRLVRLLAETAPKHLLSPSFAEDCQRCIVQGDASGLIRFIVNDSGAICAMLVLEEQEAVSAFSLLTALLDKVRAEEASGLAAALADAVEKTQMEGEAKENMSTRRITLLSVLYNMRVDGRSKCTLLTKMFRLAIPSMLAEDKPLGSLLLEESEAGSLRLTALVDGWNITAEDRRELFKAVASSIPGQLQRQRFRLLLIEGYTDVSETDADGLAAAKDAAVGAIQDPVSLFMQQRSMLSMPAIRALSNSDDTKVLHGLLTVFQEGKLEDYFSFVKANGGDDKVLAPWGLSSEDCVRHMRILSMCSLAVEHEEIPYSSIAQTLQLPSEKEVESWVIAAVSSGLLAAKMDQLQQKVMVERSVVRRFDMDQWKALQSQLNLWKQNLKGILDAFQQTQEGAVLGP